MKQRLLWISLMASLSSTGFASGEKVEEIATPSVPASLLKEKGPGTLESIRVQPGSNAMIPIAVGHLNRLVLPFEDPSIRTVNPATTQLEGHVLYVAPSDENPITLYVTPGKNEDFALSLTLAPQRIPPREIHLALDQEALKKLQRLSQTHPGFVGQGKDAPATDHRSQEYIAEIKGLFRALALGQSPQGFNLRAPENGESLYCQQKGLQFKTGQVLEGRDLILMVGVAKNSESRPIDLDERACANPVDTLAVAAWPSPRIEAGHAAEVFIALRQVADNGSSLRPSLIGVQP
jgi:conjugal transfer pilus assembly protein TraK